MQGGYEVNTNTPQSGRLCQRKQIERRRSGRNGKRLAGVNAQREQSPFDRRAELRHSAGAVEKVRQRHCPPSATTVTGWKQQEKQCEDRAACKQPRVSQRQHKNTHIHGIRCSREGAVSTFNAGGGGGGKVGWGN